MNTIEVQLTEKQYTNASMILYLRKPIIWISPFILLLLILPKLLNSSPDYKFSQSDSFIVFLIIYLLLTPLLIYYRAKKFYGLPSTCAKEKVNYEFQENQLVQRGETFYSETNWKTIYKVDSTKKWVFIWLNPVYPTPILKSAIWEGELLRLREILDTNQIKHNIQ
jgi:hypothetical protein